MKVNAKKISLTAILSALATLSFMLESLFPPLFLPGARMGISNIFILLVAYLLGGKFAFFTLMVKTILGSLFSGNVSSLLYSLTAGTVALCVELTLIYIIKKVSTVCVSIAGSILNTTVQNLVFCLFTGAIEYLSYLPYLASISVISGIIVGFATHLILIKTSKIKNKTVDKGEIS